MSAGMVPQGLPHGGFASGEAGANGGVSPGGARGGKSQTVVSGKPVEGARACLHVHARSSLLAVRTWTGGVTLCSYVLSGNTDWAGYTAPDGRTYYYNGKTGVSSWEKPAPVGGS